MTTTGDIYEIISSIVLGIATIIFSNNPYNLEQTQQKLHVVAEESDSTTCAPTEDLGETILNLMEQDNGIIHGGQGGNSDADDPYELDGNTYDIINDLENKTIIEYFLDVSTY